MEHQDQRKSRASIEYTSEFRFGSSSSQTSQNSGDFCRICHENDASKPLLTPCLCSGSLRFVHQSCLQQWLTASETNSCELCKFPFIMQSKIKPFCEWRSLDMSGVERRRLFCVVIFHCAAALCVIWSLCVLIERSADEIRTGRLEWPFWIKLVVVTVGLTGGVVFMYVQCKQYLGLCSRWRARNRIILIQNAPEKVAQPLSPATTQRLHEHPTSILQRNEHHALVISTPLNGVSELVHEQEFQRSTVANIENNCIELNFNANPASPKEFAATCDICDAPASSKNENAEGSRNPENSKVGSFQNQSDKDPKWDGMFNENDDILNDRNYPKLCFHHSTLFLAPSTRMEVTPDTASNETRDEKRRNSDTRLMYSKYVAVDMAKSPQTNTNRLSSQLHTKNDTESSSPARDDISFV